MNSRIEKVTLMNEQELEKKIQDKGLNAPRLNPELIDSVIVSAKYHVFEGTTTTVCCLLLKNGSTVIGESACVSPENFDEEVGREIAYKNAREEIWGKEGYLLKENLYIKSRLVTPDIRGTIAVNLEDRKSGLEVHLVMDSPQQISYAIDELTVALKELSGK